MRSEILKASIKKKKLRDFSALKKSFDAPESHVILEGMLSS